MPRFQPSTRPPGTPTADALWFVFRKDQLLVREAEAPAVSRLAQAKTLGLDRLDAHYLGRFDGRDCFAVSAGDDEPPGYSFQSLRSLFVPLGEELWSVAGRASRLVRFGETHRFCGRCGEPTEAVDGEHARRCPKCHLAAYPPVSPAIIVLVRRGEEALLAHGTRFPRSFYSTLAGFVEPGESLEDALHREVREEAGIAVEGLTYFGSQPWPFPHSLMVGFTARWAAGEIAPDGREIVDARWFGRDGLPELPPNMSIARRLIDAWLNEADPAGGGRGNR